MRTMEKVVRKQTIARQLDKKTVIIRSSHDIMKHRLSEALAECGKQELSSTQLKNYAQRYLILALIVIIILRIVAVTATIFFLPREVRFV